jgi:lipopolysaccharide export system ATP-binding protein
MGLFTFLFGGGKRRSRKRRQDPRTAARRKAAAAKRLSAGQRLAPPPTKRQAQAQHPAAQSPAAERTREAARRKRRQALAAKAAKSRSKKSSTGQTAKSLQEVAPRKAKSKPKQRGKNRFLSRLSARMRRKPSPQTETRESPETPTNEPLPPPATTTAETPVPDLKFPPVPRPEAATPDAIEPQTERQARADTTPTPPEAALPDPLLQPDEPAPPEAKAPAEPLRPAPVLRAEPSNDQPAKDQSPKDEAPKPEARPRVEPLLRAPRVDAAAADGKEAAGKAKVKGESKPRAEPRLVADNKGLVAENLGKRFKKRPIVRDVSMALQRGEAVGLLGPNGAGKTTCFYMITGLLSADYGAISLDGTDISDLPMYRRARLGIGYLPQEASIFRGLTVEQNLRAVLEVVEPKRERRETFLDALLAEFSISHLRRTPALALSGGERRRVEIARALASQPSFMLLDEPLAGIDPVAVRDIRELVSHLKDRGLGVLITDHNVRETLDIVDRAYILHEGRVLMEGTPDEIVRNRDVRRVYLGERFSL